MIAVDVDDERPGRPAYTKPGAPLFVAPPFVPPRPRPIAKTENGIRRQYQNAADRFWTTRDPQRREAAAAEMARFKRALAFRRAS